MGGPLFSDWTISFLQTLPFGLSQTVFYDQKLNHFSTPKMVPKIVNFRIFSESIFWVHLWGPVFSDGTIYLLQTLPLGLNRTKKWTQRRTLKWFRFGSILDTVFEVSERYQNRSILRFKKRSILRPLKVPNSLLFHCTK